MSVSVRDTPNRFASFAEERGDEYLRSETAVAWAAMAGSPHARHIRLRDLALFAEFASAEDARHEVPPRGLFPNKWRRRPPYIYTDDEIGELLRFVGDFGPPGSLRPATYQTIFGLLVATGMRISEALELRVVDVSEDALVIRETKFQKSRWLPVHSTTAAALAVYKGRWRQLADGDAPFFTSGDDRLVHYWQVKEVFLAATRAAGIRPPAGVPSGPRRPARIHDLRHTFAVRALESARRSDGPMDRHMLALATYLGHTFPRYTYWYLESTPQLLTGIADACEALDEERDR